MPPLEEYQKRLLTFIDQSLVIDQLLCYLHLQASRLFFTGSLFLFLFHRWTSEIQRGWVTH